MLDGQVAALRSKESELESRLSSAEASAVEATSLAQERHLQLVTIQETLKAVQLQLADTKVCHNHRQLWLSLAHERCSAHHQCPHHHHRHHQHQADLTTERHERVRDGEAAAVRAASLKATIEALRATAAAHHAKPDDADGALAAAAAAEEASAKAAAEAAARVTTLEQQTLHAEERASKLQASLEQHRHTETELKAAHASEIQKLAAAMEELQGKLAIAKEAAAIAASKQAKDHDKEHAHASSLATELEKAQDALDAERARARRAAADATATIEDLEREKTSTTALLQVLRTVTHTLYSRPALVANIHTGGGPN